MTFFLCIFSVVSIRLSSELFTAFEQGLERGRGHSLARSFLVYQGKQLVGEVGAVAEPPEALHDPQ